jgi:hypothetical protein
LECKKNSSNLYAWNFKFWFKGVILGRLADLGPIMGPKLFSVRMIYEPCEDKRLKSKNHITKDVSIFHLKLGNSCRLNYFRLPPLQNTPPITITNLLQVVSV